MAMVEDMQVTGTRTAKVMYNARGWVAHHNTDLWRATAPIDGPPQVNRQLQLLAAVPVLVGTVDGIVAPP